MKNNRLARAVVTALPDETLAAVDVYNEKAKGVVNSVRDYLSTKGLDIGAMVRGGKTVASLIPAVVNMHRQINPDNLLQRLTAASGAAGHLVSRLPEEMLENAQGYLKNSQELLAEVGGVMRLVDHTDFKSVRDVGHFINTLNGSELITFSDPNSLSAVAVSVIDDAQRHGLGSVFNELTRDMSRELSIRVAKGALPSSIEYSDIQLAKDVIDKIGGDNVRITNPTFIYEFAQNYRWKESAEPLQALDTFHEIYTTFNEIDATWLKAYRLEGSEAIVDTTKLSGVSDDFKELLDIGMRGKEISMDLLAAYSALEPYPPNVVDALKRQLPFRINTPQPSSGAITYPVQL